MVFAVCATHPFQHLGANQPPPNVYAFTCLNETVFILKAEVYVCMHVSLEFPLICQNQNVKMLIFTEAVQM